MKITISAVKKRIATSVIVVALIVVGVYGLIQLPVNFLPDMTYPMIKIHIWWRGATPSEIETNIAEPIERQMATVDGVDYLESSSIEGMYTLVVNFKYGVNIDVAYQDALAAMARVARQIPRDIDPPIVIKADPTQLPIVQLTVRSDQWDLVQLRTWADNWFQDQLLTIPGVAGTEVVGGLKREIRVHLDPLAMEKYRLSPPIVIKRLQEENLEQFGGRVTTGPHEIIARTMGEYSSLDEIRALVITRNGASKITLADIAEVKDAHEEARVITRLNGNPSVKMSILKQPDANTVEVAQQVSKKIEELKPSLPEGMQLGMIENQANYVLPALNGVKNAAIEAAALVFVVIYFFLGSWRQVVVMLLALPITLVLNFALMSLAGFSLNIFSMGGLVVAVGVVLDNSIVVIENISRLREHSPETVSSEDLAINGTSEVGSAILAATLAFISLFVPFLLVPGLTSLLFKELILVIAGIVCISLVIAVTLTPMLAAMLLGKNTAKPLKKSLFERGFERTTSGYGWFLTGALRFPRTTVLLFVLILAGAVFLSPKLGSEFLPKMDDGRIMVKVKLPTGAAVAETDALLKKIEKTLSGDPLIESAFTLSGGKVWGLYTFEIANEGEVNIQLIPRHERDVSTKTYLKQPRKKLTQITVPGGKVMAKQAKIKGLKKLGSADIEIKIKGQETEKLFSLAKKTAVIMKELNQFTNVYVSMDMSKPEFQIVIDRIRAAELGVSVANVAITIRSLVSGAVASQYREGDDFYNIRLMIPEEKIRSLRDIEDLVLENDQGAYFRLRDVAQVRRATGPVEIVREDQIKEVIVRGDVANTSVGEALTSLKEAMPKISIPVGYQISYGGQAQMMAEMKQTISLILAFAIFFAFVVLAVQFNSLKLPALILGSVPFCVAGIVYALYLTNIPLGATVLIGMLVVVASTVNEGVLLLTVVEEMRKIKKMPVFDAIVHAAKIRLRPRVMIAVAVIAGFVPLALNLEEGGDMLQPMAVGAIGGLFLGLFVALFLLPCLYLLFTRQDRIEKT